MYKFIFFFLVLMISFDIAVFAMDNNDLREVHKDIFFIAKVADPEKTFDIVPAEPTKVLTALKNAVDILFDKSPYTTRAIKKLQKKGKILIVYDPNHPRLNLAKLVIASFLPDYYQENTNMKTFVVVLGRYGGKWPARDLASIIAHELSGHGIQHMERRLKNTRMIDLECEAYLFQEKAYQDLEYDKNKPEMAAFRKKLEQHWCADFRSWIGKNEPSKLVYWNQINPNVPKLLELFKQYTLSLRMNGITLKTIDTANALREKLGNENVRQLANSNKPVDYYKLGIKYLDRIRAAEDLIIAVKWLEKPSGADHTKAKKSWQIF